MLLLPSEICGTTSAFPEAEQPGPENHTHAGGQHQLQKLHPCPARPFVLLMCLGFALGCMVTDPKPWWCLI